MHLRRRKTLHKNISDVVAEDGETLAVIFRDPAPDPEQHCVSPLSSPFREQEVTLASSSEEKDRESRQYI
jgi:hypothetical protein